MVLVKGTEGKGTLYESPSLSDNQATFAGVRSAGGVHAVRVVYANGSAATRIVGLEVNGAFVTKIAFPPTGGRRKYVTIEVPFSSSASDSTLKFTNLRGKGIALKSLTVLAGAE